MLCWKWIAWIILSLLTHSALTCSQSILRKNVCDLISVKPVWTWQPSRSLGSCWDQDSWWGTSTGAVWDYSSWTRIQIRTTPAYCGVIMLCVSLPGGNVSNNILLLCFRCFTGNEAMWTISKNAVFIICMWSPPTDWGRALHHNNYSDDLQSEAASSAALGRLCTSKKT